MMEHMNKCEASLFGKLIEDEELSPGIRWNSDAHNVLSRFELDEIASDQLHRHSSQLLAAGEIEVGAFAVIFDCKSIEKNMVTTGEVLKIICLKCIRDY